MISRHPEKLKSYTLLLLIATAFQVYAATPVLIVPSIATGKQHSCMNDIYGAVTCWGRNEFGQLGIASFGELYNTGQYVGIADPVSAVTAGWSHTCALTEQGAVLCWGQNDNGQLGNGTVARSNIPVVVTGLTTAIPLLSNG